MYSEIAANKRKTVFLMIFFVAFVSLLSWVITALFLDNKTYITVYFLVGALTYAAIAYFAASKTALKLNHATPIAKKDNPRLYRIVENLCITDGLPMPQVYIIADPAPNAFATGRDPKRASVAVTTGLLEIMDDAELQGVLAHELGHVKNYDIRVSMIVFGLVAAISLLADLILHLTWFSDNDDNNPWFFLLGIVAAILAPFCAMLIQLSISRKREYLADATGALTTRYPEGLANALAKIEKTGSVMKHQNGSTAHLYFANPLKGKGISKFFSTHPPIADRIARLKKMEDHQ